MILKKQQVAYISRNNRLKLNGIGRNFSDKEQQHQLSRYDIIRNIKLISCDTSFNVKLQDMISAKTL